MAKKQTEEKAFSGNRTMNKLIPQYTHANNPVSPVPWTKSKNGWEYTVTPVTGLRYIVYQTYFDLSGYSLSDLTTQAISVIIQEATEYISVPDAASPRTEIEMIDLISAERPDPSHIVDTMAQQNGPGFSLSELSFDQIVWNRYRMYVKDSTVWSTTNGIMSKHTELVSGSGTAVAVDKLWITRIIFPQGVYDADPFTFIRWPASTVVLNAAIYKEDELPYLMRLKRSYELGTG